ncbi:MAG TPA: M20/M25/M40 family metallo-hydrolase [Thermoanaerobaculia bacterium]|jgi:Zn-dependent M28 family amino/carboxypeptidase|nr:M20/M25/M40 family metallo-hydrolase [Thermoanaerobaculia bacterium]
MLRSLAILAILVLCAGPLASQPAVPLADLGKLRSDSNAGRLQALREILKAHGIPFEVQTFTSDRGEGHNLVAAFGAGSREIVVGAHYDAVKLKDGTLSHGMVDDGAGVIALVRLAEALRGRPLRHRLRIVFFDQEELGLLGSKAFVAALKPADAAVVANVNVDIVAYGDTLVFGGGKGEANGPLVRALQRVCAARRLACIEFSPHFPAGDDRSFDAAGIPNVSIGFGPAADAHQLWLLLNGGKDSGLKEGFAPNLLQNMHSPGDTLEKIDPATIDRTSGLLQDLVLELDSTLDGGSAQGDKRE